VQVVNPNDQPIPVGIRDNGNGTVTVTFSGIPGTEYVVQAASEIVPAMAWTAVSTNTADANGQWTFTDESAGSQIQRYFRAVKP
jgi:hypothetical protein